MTEWLDNETLFREQLSVGHQNAEFVADAIRKHGVDVEVTPMRLRAHVDQRHDFADEYDLLVDGRHRVEVKSRSIPFFDPWDYPYPTVYVYSKRGWNRKTKKPAAIIIVSQSTGHMVVVPRSTEPRWQTKTVHDHVRNIDYDALIVDKDELRSLDAFMDWVRYP